MQRITSICGPEPRRDGEPPETYTVGLNVNKIARREENLGTYGIVWYDVFNDDVLIVSMNALAVAVVVYAPPDSEGD